MPILLTAGGEGEIESECFNAYRADITITGRVIHLGAARGKLINAVTLASAFVSMLPQAESPEATDERYGYYCPFEMKAGLDRSEIILYLRDFDLPRMEERIETVKSIGKALEAIYPGAKVDADFTKMYLNMKEHMDKVPQGLGKSGKSL